MKFLTDLAPAALTVAALFVALSTPAAAQDTAETPPVVAPQPAGPDAAAIAAHKDALVKAIADLKAGKPDYDSMVPQLAEAVRAQQGGISGKLNELGIVKSIEFKASRQNALKFQVTFANGETSWFIVMTPEGKIETLVFRPGA
jgi:hypothetical protein